MQAIMYYDVADTERSQKLGRIVKLSESQSDSRWIRKKQRTLNNIFDTQGGKHKHFVKQNNKQR